MAFTTRMFADKQKNAAFFDALKISRQINHLPLHAQLFHITNARSVYYVVCNIK